MKFRSTLIQQDNYKYLNKPPVIGNSFQNLFIHCVGASDIIQAVLQARTIESTIGIWNLFRLC